ncbi:MAG: ribosomal protein S19 family protein [Candidatus Micrarchaeaceae archaeon]
MVERIVFKGLTGEQVSKLDHTAFIKLIDSRARRAIKRNSYKYKALCEKAKKIGTKKPIKTHVREAVILPEWIGMKFMVHNGKEFMPVNITPAMVGFRLGDFAPTTKKVQHSAPGIKATRGSKFLSVK